MKELNVHELRALIRVVAPLRALRDDVEKSVHLELHSGAGDLAVRSFRGLRDSVAQITEDPYVRTLELDITEETNDRRKMAQVLIASGQLLAYVEAQTGLTGLTERRGNYSVQTAPNISLNMGDVMGGEVDRVMDIVRNAMRGVPPPPRPPRPPRPDRPSKGKRGDHTWFYQIDEDEPDDEDDA